MELRCIDNLGDLFLKNLKKGHNFLSQRLF